jgi:hypothetical protein
MDDNTYFKVLSVGVTDILDPESAAYNINLLLPVNLYDLASYSSPFIIGFQVVSLTSAANNILSFFSRVATVKSLPVLALNSSIVTVFNVLLPKSVYVKELPEGKSISSITSILAISVLSTYCILTILHLSNNPETTLDKSITILALLPVLTSLFTP